jgi:hypothetical protein
MCSLASGSLKSRGAAHLAQSALGPAGARRTVPVLDLAAKLRVTAALLGCAAQKDLCARFHAVNPATEFDLDRSYKWMQGRAQPRSARVYEDWAVLLGTESPIAQLQSCTVDEFLDLVCDHHKVSREALAARAGIVVEGPAGAVELDRADLLPGRHLVGAYACYSHAWSPYFEGKIIRGSLVIEPAANGAPALTAIYRETVAFGPIQLRGPVSIVSRAVHIELLDAAARFRLAMCLFLPGTLANVLAGVMSGATFVDADPQPASTRIVMIRIPEAGDSRLEASNRYLDSAAAPLSSDLVALGVPVTAPAELDALLDEFLASDQASRYLKVAAAEYSRLALAIDRMFIESGLALRPGQGDSQLAGGRAGS